MKKTVVSRPYYPEISSEEVQEFLETNRDYLRIVRNDLGGHDIYIKVDGVWCTSNIDWEDNA